MSWSRGSRVFAFDMPMTRPMPGGTWPRRYWVFLSWFRIANGKLVLGTWQSCCWLNWMVRGIVKIRSV